MKKLILGSLLLGLLAAPATVFATDDLFGRPIEEGSNAQLEAQQSEAEERLVTVQTEITALKEQIDTLTEEKIAVEERLAGLNEQMTELQTAIDKKTSEKSTTASFLQTVSNTITLTNLTSKNEELGSAGSTEVAEMDTLNQQLLELQQNFDQLAAERMSLVEVFTGTAAQLSAEETMRYTAAQNSGFFINNPDGWVAPLTSLNITSPFGSRSNPFGGESSEFHNGIDFSGYLNMPVMATREGQVVVAENNSSAGNVVIILHADGLYSYYMHLNSFAVKAGDTVSAGQTIGGMGTTGRSTGVHLHLGVSTALWSGYIDPTTVFYNP
ncbi:peptidoglycan DD-metalloendopeptidase family protein [Enterococcus sp. LJL120]